MMNDSALSDAEEGKIAGSQQRSMLICDLHVGLAGTVAPVADHSPGGHGAAACGTDEVQTAVQGDIVSSIGAAGGAAGTVGHGVIGAAMEQAVRVQTVRTYCEYRFAVVGTGRTGLDTVKKSKCVGM